MRHLKPQCHQIHTTPSLELERVPQCLRIDTAPRAKNAGKPRRRLGQVRGCHQQPCLCYHWLARRDWVSCGVLPRSGVPVRDRASTPDHSLREAAFTVPIPLFQIRGWDRTRIGLSTLQPPIPGLVFWALSDCARSRFKRPERSLRRPTD
jgi:hypothetical protein